MLPTQNMAIPCNYCHLFQIFNTLLLLELLIAVCADVLWESGARDTAHLLRIASAMSAFLSVQWWQPILPSIQAFAVYGMAGC